MFYQPVLCLVSWNVQSYLLVRYNSNRVCECHFGRQPVAHIYNVENIIPQEGEAVFSVALGKILWPVSVYK